MKVVSKHRANIGAAAKNKSGMRYTTRKVGGREYIYDNKEKSFVPLGRVPRIKIDTKLKGAE